MAWAVNMGVMALVGLVLNMGGIDGDAALALLRSLIDVGIVNELGVALEAKHLGDSSSKRGLAVVNVTNGTNVYMRLIAIKLFFCHCNFPPNYNVALA